MFMSSALLVAACLDWLFGEPRRLHPLIGFGQCAAAVERRINLRSRSRINRVCGVLAWLAVISPVAAACIIATSYLRGGWLWMVEVVSLYLAIAYRSWRDHLFAIYRPLQQSDLSAARTALAAIVSRDTDTLDAQGVRKAAIESGLENGADGIFAPLFWFVCLGATGAVLYRLINTLDAMWGYKNERFHQFGWCAARMDDFANWIPARLTALSYCLVGRARLGLHAWRTQARLCQSPNAGPVMAAGAGALDVQLGGPAAYQGALSAKPALGTRRAAGNEDLMSTIRLVTRAYGLWLALCALSLLLISIVESI